MMKIVVSIPVHENPEVVLDQVNNIKKYIKDVSIVLHASDQFFEVFEDFYSKNIESLKEVYLNPTHYPVVWGDGMLMDAHISNYKYISQIVDFDYYILHASNDMYVKKGIEEYISCFEAGFQKHFIKSSGQWWPGNIALKDGQLYYAMNEINTNDIVASQIEGSFYKKSIFEQIVSVIEKSDFVRDRGLKYTREEIFFPTIANKICEEHQRGYPITFSEVHVFDRKLWKLRHLTWGIYNRLGLRKVIPRYKYDNFERYNENKLKNSDNWKINKNIVQKIIKSNKKFMRKNMYLNDERTNFQLYDGNLFAVKRVERTLNNEIRKYINGLCD